MFIDLPFVEKIDFSVLRHFVLGPGIVFLLTRPKHFMSRDHVILTVDPLINGQRSFQCKTNIMPSSLDYYSRYNKAARRQILHVLAASCVKSSQFLASTLPKQLLVI
jgi:hypothetical protein